MKIVALVLTVCMAGLEAASALERPSLPSERPSGSGVIVHQDGYVLTAHHVVSNAKRIVVVTPGEFRAPAMLVSADQEHDLALLKVEMIGLTEAPLGYAGTVRLDQDVIAVGYQFGLKEITVTRGHVAAVRMRGVQRVFQVDAAVNPGNSGGALFNRRGEVIGILTTKFTHPSGIVPEGMAFAVPISYATPLLANIPDFDFTTVGRGKDPKAGRQNKEMIGDLARTSVRIETVRVPEQAVSVPSGTARDNPSVLPSRLRHNQPVDMPAVTEEAIAKTNAFLRTEQEEETRKLRERGENPPDDMALIPAGEFLMGTEDGLPDARPLHRVYLSSYLIDRYEVTNIQYRQCVDGGSCAPPRDREAFDEPTRLQYPVVNVTWSQARVFCQWSGKRLPTEAEWEKAARGTDGRRYPWGNSETVIEQHQPKGNEAKLAANGLGPIGTPSSTASPYGVYDLVGSISEWVKDWYAEDFYAVSSSRDPQGPLRGSFRVLRGAGWNERLPELRISYRGWDEMSYWGPTLGIRCAMDLP
ncbi:MAG TPA: SUMF1/EgtB/PvdO family nonheme iron enzyme [Nitrospiraceae bacterium]|nr:SUMF1/EgtB/PvdO family nonheme iron enzyme [Nitrospiraceae bacterium]